MQEPQSPTPRKDPPRLVVWLGFLAFFAVIQASTDRLAGNDTYYHIKYAWLIWHEGALWDFRWLEGTFFRDMWVDKELLYHLMLIPFTLGGDLYYGAKAAGAVGGATALFAAYLVIRSFGEPGSIWRRHSIWFALVLAAGSKAMLYRLSTARVPSASVAFMMLGLWLMNKKAWRGLFALGFFYAWMYHVSVVLVPFAAFFALGQRMESGRWDLKPVFATGIGICAGFVINPYFPDSLPVLFKHVIQVGLGGTGLPKGGEWAAYDSWYLMNTTAVAWYALLAAVIALGGTRRTMSARTFSLLLCAALMTAAFFKARRFVEYFPVFMIVFSASAIHDLVHDPESWFAAAYAKHRRSLRAIYATTILVLCVVAGFNNWNASREAHQNANPWRLAGAAQWLQANTPEGSQVYNAQWDVFPELIFHNHHNSWTLGLDPNFTYFLDPRLYYISERLGAGQVPEGGRFVREAFGCEYAVALKNSGFARSASFKTSGLAQVFEDDFAKVWRVQPDTSVLTIEGELSPVSVEPQSALQGCAWTEAKPGMGSASSKALYMCKVASNTPLILSYPIDVPVAGDWKIEARFLKGPTPATATLRLDGIDQGPVISLQSKTTRLGQIDRPGSVSLSQGPHILEVRFEGHPGPHEMVFGLDYVRLRRR